MESTLEPGRSRAPALTREVIIRAALEIIDEDGLESLTTRRLAEKLGIRGPSLYNHFANKEEIVLRTAEYALTNIRSPRRLAMGSSKDLLMWGARALRSALEAHPNLVGVMITNRSTGLGNAMVDLVSERLLRDGVPAEVIMPLLESLERWTIGSAVRMVSPQEPVKFDPDELPSLARVMNTRRSADALFDQVVEAIIDRVLS